MQKLFKWTTVSVLSFLTLIIITLIVLTTFVDPNRFKPMIIEKVHATTGRTLVWNSDVHWSFFPSLGIKLGEMSMSNAPGFGNQPFFAFKKAKVSVSLLPLLHKKLELNDLSVNGLSLNLMKNQKGITNWEDLKKAATSTEGEKPVEKSSGAAFSKNDILGMIVPRIDIQHVNFSWDDQKTGQKVLVQDINLSAKNIQTREAFPIELSFQIQNKKPEVSGQANLTTHVRINDQLLELNSTAIQILMRGAFLPDGKVSFKLSAPYVYVGEHELKTKPLTIDLNDTHITTDFQAAEKEDNKIGSFNMDINQIDLDQWLNVLSKLSSPSEETPTPKSNSNQAAGMTNSMALIKTVDLNGHVSIGNLKAAKMRARKVEARLRAVNGIIHVKPMKAQFYKGNIDTYLHINAQGVVPQITFKGGLSNVQVQPLLTDLVGQDKFVGTGNFSADLSTQGLNANTVTRSLNGQLQFSLNNGVLRGIDIPYYIRTGKALLKKQPQPSQTGPNETDFGNMTGTAAIESGVLSNKDLHILGPSVEVTGAGQINLVNQSMNYSLQAMDPKDKNPIVPILITGSFTHPSIQLDVKKLLQSIVQQQIEQKKGEIFKSLLSGGFSDNTSQQPKTEQKAEEKSVNSKEALQDRINSLLSSLGQ